MRIPTRGKVTPLPITTANPTYDIHSFDNNKQQFHLKESLTRLFQKVL